MAKQCPACQQLLDESARFCPICGTQVSEIKPLDAPIEIAKDQLPPPLIPQTVSSTNSSQPPASSPTSSRQDGLIKPALLAGIVLGVASALPFVNCCCWLWVLASGVLAVYLYRHESDLEVTPGRGARLGFLAGLFGALSWEILDLPISYIYGPERVRQLQDLVERTHNLPAESLQVFHWILELLSQPFHPVVILFGILSKLFICGVLTTLGGILGVAFFGKPKSRSS